MRKNNRPQRGNTQRRRQNPSPKAPSPEKQASPVKWTTEPGYHKYFTHLLIILGILTVIVCYLAKAG